MAKKKSNQPSRESDGSRPSSSVDELLLAAIERGESNLETGRYVITFKESAVEEGLQSLGVEGMRVADARDFDDQSVVLESVGDADAIVFPEIGVAVVGGDAANERSMNAHMEIASDSPIESIDPEYFMFALNVLEEYQRIYKASQIDVNEYLRGFFRAAEAIANDLKEREQSEEEGDEETMVLGATWGLVKCKVPTSTRTGAGIKVAILDTGFDLGHPDFAGRPIISNSFVGQPVQDLNGHGTHCTGTATGPKAPAGTTPRYGIGYKSSIYIGKVLTNSGTGAQAGVLAGMNWAIANRCTVISMSLGAQIGVQPSYTAAGNAALNNGCLIVAAAGNAGSNTGAPANSPSIMSVASLDPSLSPSSFSNFGKIEIAAPGRDVFSAWPRPRLYNTISGTSMATPHVAGCAALWAESSSTLRGTLLWKKLQATAKPLPFPASRVGKGLVQAP